jgi:hypothetical protein
VCCAAVWLRVGEVRKGPLPPFPCEGQFPQHYKYSGLVAGCWLQGAGCWLLVGGAGSRARARAHLGPRRRALCPEPPPGGGWLLGAGGGAYVCGCAWVCASNKAKRCFSCMYHAAAAACAAVAAFGGGGAAAAAAVFGASADAGASAAFNATGAGASPPSPLPPRASPAARYCRCSSARSCATKSSTT